MHRTLAHTTVIQMVWCIYCNKRFNDKSRLMMGCMHIMSKCALYVNSLQVWNIYGLLVHFWTLTLLFFVFPLRKIQNCNSTCATFPNDHHSCLPALHRPYMQTNVHYAIWNVKLIVFYWFLHITKIQSNRSINRVCKGFSPLSTKEVSIVCWFI